MSKKISLLDEWDLDFKLPTDFEDENLEAPEIEQELQRTDSWRMIRNGCWTASASKGLMSCNPKGGRMTWDNPYKVLEFSSGALKSVYEVAKSRQRGYYIESDSGTSARYGTAVEPLIFEIVKEYQKEKGYMIQKVGFVNLPNIPTAGVSSDLIIGEIQGSYVVPLMNGEIKACVNWGTHYDRCFDFLDEKGTDFWQVQMQMLAHGVGITLYIVSEPPPNIKKYVYCEPNKIMELLPDFKKECVVSYQEVKASPLHQKALLIRISIAEKTVQRWLEEGGNIKDILYEEIDLVRKEMKDNLIFVSRETIEENTEKFISEHELPEENKLTSVVLKEIEELVEENINLEDLPKDFPF